MHQQLTIEFDANHKARRSDPETSKAAARNAARFSTTHAGRIHLALISHGPRTAHELSQLIGLSVVQIDRRFPDLKAAGLADLAKLDDGAVRTLHGFRVWRALP